MRDTKAAGTVLLLLCLKCHESNSHKKINSVNYLRELERECPELDGWLTV